MKSAARFAAAFAIAAVLLANPPRKPLVPCGACGSQNDIDARTSCRNCGARL